MKSKFQLFTRRRFLPLLACMSLRLLQPFAATAQNDCLTPSLGDDPRGYSSISGYCAPSSSVFHAYYKHKENYIPDVSLSVTAKDGMAGDRKEAVSIKTVL